MATKAKLHFSILPHGMHAKMTWAFVFMSCVPIGVLVLIAAWFAFPYTREAFPMLAVFFIDPKTEPAAATWWLWAVIVLTVVIAALGSVYLTMKIVEPVLQVGEEAKRIAENPTSGGEMTGQEDELGDVTNALNQLTSRIRSNMLELQQVGERTNQISVEVQKRMVILASLLQIGEFIGGAKDLDTVLDLVVERLGSLEDHTFSFLCLQPHEALRVIPRRAHHLDVKRLTQVVFASSSLVVDADHPPTETCRGLWEELGKPNLLMQPILLRKHLVGVLAVGNHAPHYVFAPELIDLVSVFVKQASIALENELLLSKNKALAVQDELTGLYNENYIRQRIDEEIKRAIAYQRPCAVAVFAVDAFVDFQRQRGEVEMERALKKIGRVIQESVTEIDRVGRFNTNEFVAVLPERNKRQAIEIAEEIRRRVQFAFASSPEEHDRLTVSGSVAENPLDGVTADDLLSKARTMVNGAAERSHNAVVT